MQLERLRPRAGCLISYKNAETYQSNFEHAYRELVKPDATAIKCKIASQEYGLFVRADSLPWFKGYIPVSAIRETQQANFLQPGSEVVFIKDKDAIRFPEGRTSKQRAASSLCSMPDDDTRSTQDT